MTHILDRLERQDLIERLADPDDRRGVLVGLTRKGHRVFAAAALANERGMLQALSPAERKQPALLLRKLLLSFERREAVGDKAKEERSEPRATNVIH